MTCPFKHLWAEEAKKQLSVKNTEEISTKSPQNDAQKTPDGSEIYLNDTKHSSSSHSASFPAGFGHTYDKNTNPQSPPPAPTCPLGFGSSSGPKLSSLHCMICKSFLYNCTLTNCGHKYCHACISRFQDCPTCGHDITSLSPDPTSQEVVEEFLRAHAGDMNIWDLEEVKVTKSSKNNDRDDITTSRDKASFILQLGVRAMAGGNIENALYRFIQCKEQLEKEIASTDGASGIIHNDSIKAKLGAVCGCIGDCYRSQRRFDDALSYYKESMQYLAPENDTTNKNMDDACIAVNKIGEVYHMQGNLTAALDKYKESLHMRRIGLETSVDDGEESKNTRDTSMNALQRRIDVAVCEIKVADCMNTLLEEKESKNAASTSPSLYGGIDGATRDEHVQAARILLDHVCDEIERRNASDGDSFVLPTGLMNKLNMLLQYVNERSV